MCEGEYGRTPLHFASQSGNLDVIKYFIDEQHIDPSCQDVASYPGLRREGKRRPGAHCLRMRVIREAIIT